MSNDLREVEVLLVDDTATDAELCMRTFAKQNIANEVAWVKDGAEALDYLFDESPAAKRRGMPKLILLDLQLPKVQGLEVLRLIKQDNRTKCIPVVALTSSEEDRDVVESYNLGVNSYISKPVEFSAFVETIAQLGMYWLMVNHAPHTRR
jgi:CheY-like chemotaxis protein